MKAVDFSVEAMPGDVWGVVLKRPDAADEYLVDTAGKVCRFDTVTAAFIAGERAVGRVAIGSSLEAEARAWRNGRRRR